MTGLGDLPGGAISSSAYGVSADGSVVVGISHSAYGNQAFRWEAGAMIGLGFIPGGALYSQARDVSADGSIVVGESNSGLAREAFIWDAENGMRSLKDLLVNDFSLDLADWTLNKATAISDDGLTIVGYGLNPDGEQQGWVATIPEPATLLLLGLGWVVVRRKQ